MSKKFTSFLVLAAALLLTVPTQAQLAKKAARQQVTLQAGPLKVNDVQKVKAAQAKVNDKTVGLAFTGAKHQLVAAEATFLKAAINNIEDEKASFEKMMAENMAGSHKQVNSILYGFPRQISFTSSAQTVNPRRAETVDDHGIITAPAEGELKYYTRTGTAYYYNSGWKVTTQSGHAEVVECADGTVYIKNPISRLGYESYIKGTKSENTITIPAGQPILYNATYQATIDVKIGAYVSGTGFAPNAEQSDIIFTVDGNTLTLQGTSSTDYVVLGAFWSDDNSMQSGDAETVLTLDADYTPASTDPVVAPAGLVTETWNTKIDGEVSTATIGFDNNDVYIKGLLAAYPDAWIKGTIDGTTVTFAKMQFVGTYGTYNIWATSVDAEGKLADFVMTYDAAAKVLTGSDLLLNAADDKVYYLAWLENIAIQEASFEEPAAETGANVDALPYSNALASADDFGVFGVLDSNADDYTWAFSEDYGAYYSYTSANDADDWLISPAIKLEAGKKYHFAIDAASASANYPEAFEVLLGTEAKASALTQSVLAATEVATKEFVTYENEAVSVAETGYYHFGIHAISDADMFRLMVKNFLVEAGAEPTAPAAVTDFAVAQTPNVLEAVVSFKAPTKTVAGDDLTDLTKIDVLRDGQVINSISPSINWVAADQGYENSQDITSIDFGAGLTAALAQNDASTHPRYWANDKSLRLYDKNSMTISGGVIKKVVFTFVSSSNNKLAAEGLVVDGATGTWTGSANEIAFTATGGKAFIQKIEIEYEGSLTPGAEYSYTDNAEDLTIGTHVYQVIPYNASGIGIKSEEKSIFLSVTLEAPYTFDFSENLLDLFTVIDNNNDGKTWQWNANGYAYYPYSGANDADDYLITLPFNLKAGKRYNVVVNARNTEYEETFEVKAGKAPTVEGLTETVIAETAPTEEAEDYEGVFSPTEDGEYYFAIHATSPADQYNLIVSSLTIEIAPELTAPAAVADLTATAGAEGALEANLAFTAPAKAINGDALAGNVDVKIYRDGEVVNTLSGVAAGSTQTWKDTDVENGKIYTYYVVAANESGDGDKSEKVKVFVGTDQLDAVANIQMTASTANSISLSWDEATGVNGGYVNTAKVKYAAVSMHVETYWFWSYLVVDEVLGTVTGQTSGTFDYAFDEGEQDYKYFGVVALEEDAELPAAGYEYAGAYTYALVGAPYELPFLESFTGKLLHYLWDTNATLMVSDDATDDDGVALEMLAEEAGTVYLQSGKIDIKGTANPVLLFNAKSPNVSKLYVLASVDGGEQSLAASIDLTENYQNCKISLAGLNATRYIQFTLLAQYATPYTVDDAGTSIVDKGDYITIDEIRVLDLFEYNLVADIKAPASVVAGQKAKVVATVTNFGENAAKDYTVTIKAGEKALTTVLGSEELAPFAKDEIEIDFETSVFDEAGDVTLSVTVDYENELNPDDNTASAIITVKEPTAAAPLTLAAENKGAEGVELTWTVASSDADAVSQVTEGFDDEEAFEAFTLGGITAEQHTGEVGGWTLYDGNGIGVYGFQGAEFPNAYQVAAWQVFAPAAISDSFAESYAPHSGSQFMISFCPAEEDNTPAADHWLISPVLPGVSQTISFYARALTNQYGAETFEVLASSTDKEVASFTKVADFSTDATEWTEFTADLPAGTKYFAIRHTATDVFGLLVDDVTFMSAGGAEAPASFNIYLASEQIANVEGDKTTYTVAADKLTIGENTFAVTAVYANGAESKPVTATITITTDIRQIAADGKAVDVYSVDGKLVRSQATSLDGLKGLYIVNGKVVMVK